MTLSFVHKVLVIIGMLAVNSTNNITQTNYCSNKISFRNKSILNFIDVYSFISKESKCMKLNSLRLNVRDC